MRTAKYYKTFIEKNFSVISKDDKKVPFLLNPTQDKILNNLTGYDIILKARRHGISSLILACMAVEFLMTDNFRAVVVSHETKATQKLLDKVQFFIAEMKSSLPPGVEMPLKMKYSSRNEMANELRNSSFYIGTAGAKAFGRGDQISWLHLSEAAYYDDLEKFLVGIVPSVQGGSITLETTANGYNFFRTLWKRNEEKPSPYKTHFLAWYEHPDYVYPISPNAEVTEEEKALQEKYNLNINQIAWRRYELDRLNGDIDKFNQEYPANAEEAFIASGNHVWSPSLLRWYMNRTKEPATRGQLYGNSPVHFEENEEGYLRIFKAPNRSHTYVIGADVAEGKVKNREGDNKGDYSCAQVLDQTTQEQVAVWHGHIDPDLYGVELEMLGNFYNRALIAVEKNSIGLTTLTKLRDLYYPNLYYRERFGLQAERISDELGWVTDRMTKDLIVNTGTQLLREKRVQLYDADTVGEMMGFVRNAHGTAEAASGYNDDRVMALLIAMKMLSQPQSASHGNPIERDVEAGSPLMISGEEFSFEDFAGEGLLQ